MWKDDSDSSLLAEEIWTIRLHALRNQAIAEAQLPDVGGPPIDLKAIHDQRVSEGLHQKPVLESCDMGHDFYFLPDHPERDDGSRRCPRCMAQGLSTLKIELDAEREKNQEIDKRVSAVTASLINKKHVTKEQVDARMNERDLLNLAWMIIANADCGAWKKDAEQWLEKFNAIIPTQPTPPPVSSLSICPACNHPYEDHIKPTMKCPVKVDRPSAAVYETEPKFHMYQPVCLTYSPGQKAIIGAVNPPDENNPRYRYQLILDSNPGVLFPPIEESRGFFDTQLKAL